MKTMVVISHPTIQTSSSQQFSLQLKRGEAVTVRHLDEVWRKRNLILQSNGRKSLWLDSQAKRLILQFPMYWYQAPSVMKEWIDTVMSKSALLQNKLRNSESL